MPEQDWTLITGSSAGIGATLAQEFAAQGHSLILVARKAPALEALATALQQRYAVDCRVICADLAEPTGVDVLCQALQAQQLHVGILVNNAGVLHQGRFWEVSLADQLQLMQLNMLAVAALTHRLLPPMLARGAGRILNLASTSAFFSVPQLSSYAASKAFVLSLTEALGIELQGSGVTATAVCPGFTDTGMIAADGKPAMRLPLVPNMTPEEVAREAYRACMSGTPVQVVGLGNRLAAELMRRQPRWLQRAASAWLGPAVLSGTPLRTLLRKGRSTPERGV